LVLIFVRGCVEPWLLNAIRRRSSLEHFQESYRESNLELKNYTLVNERTNTDFSHHASACQWPLHSLSFLFSPFSAVQSLFLSICGAK